MGKTIIGSGRHLRLVSVDGWEFAERQHVSGVVAILAVTDTQAIVLTEQYRPAVAARVIDLPAGLAGDVAGAEKEDLAEAAQRELIEETGYEAGQLQWLAEAPSSAGLTSEIITFFQAMQLTKVAQGGGDASEDIQVHEIPREELRRWLQEQSAKGTLVDPKIYAVLFLTDQKRTER